MTKHPGVGGTARRLFHAAAATHVGVKPSTWRDYYADRRTPDPDGHEADRGHLRPYWYPETLDSWNAARPGRGARTDRRKG